MPACNKFEISDLYPIVGIYKGKIITCSNELIELNPTDSTFQLYQRDITILSYNQLSTNEKNSLNEKLFCSNDKDLKGKKKRTLLIETNWLCVNPTCDSIGTLFIVPVELMKSKNGKNDFELNSSNLVEDIQNCNLSCEFSIKSLKGFYSNGAIQIDYTIKTASDSMSYTMIGQKA